ncbi:MAG: transglutaminase domain-containing protein [Clostridiales bacterium]|nr:transglutaminase domain-containing protein [Clostridiales bacterium]
MKKIESIISIALIASLVTGCSVTSTPTDTTATYYTSAIETIETSTAAESSETSETEPTESTPRAKKEGHYKFKDHVFPEYMDEMMGKKIHEAYDNYIDAVLAGEDYFDCADQQTYDWMIGQCAYACYPVIARYTGTAYADGFKNGKGMIRYDLPKDELKQKIEEFKTMIEGILNETLEDDYSDFEKALALYIYFADNYTYDYYAADNFLDSDLWAYRVFTEKTGICQEFSVAYSYLLLQAGVDATVMSGRRSYDQASHQWSYATINGKYYQIDPTYVIGNGYTLFYFLMDDNQRTEADTYVPANSILCNAYATETKKGFKRDSKYDCTDTSYQEIWKGNFDSMDTDNNILRYFTWDEDFNPVYHTFDYGALEN